MHKQRHLLKKDVYCIAMVSLLTTTVTMASSNFTISPATGYAWPTTISPHGSVSAYYTITNNTQSTRSNYVISGLPPTVVQNTSSVSFCPSTITLNAEANCTLRLDISGPVDSSFALCRGASCTTADTPLRILQATGAPFSIAAGFYETSTSLYPLIAQSTDGGSTWAYIVDSL